MSLFSRLCGRKLDIDEAVYRSELVTGHRNRAIAYFMLNTGMIKRDPSDVLDLYFRQCSVSVTTKDLAIMAATLANDGVNPLTGEAVFDAQYVRDVLSVMNSCGMYDYAGEWAYEIGMPAKSGVSGCIIAAIPGQIGIAVYSPPIDAQGNSVRGIRVCQELSEEFELHAFNNRTNVRSVIRRDYRADRVRSNRLRTPEADANLRALTAQLAPALDWVKAHDDVMKYAVDGLIVLGAIAILLNLWRAASFTRMPICGRTPTFSAYFKISGNSVYFSTTGITLRPIFCASIAISMNSASLKPLQMIGVSLPASAATAISSGLDPASRPKL